jgi:hypothetical protein
LDHLPCRLRRAGVIPQECGADNLTGTVEADHAVLLTSDRYGHNVVQSAGVGNGFLEGCPPMVGMDLSSVRVACFALAEQFTGACVTDHHLAGLRGAIDPSHEDHWIFLCCSVRSVWA